MKLLTVIGARPQFIKAGTVSREIKKHRTIKEIIVHTGQHYDLNMSDVFFEQMKIPTPDYNLGVSGASHGAMTGRMIQEIEEVLLKEKPDKVLVYGDTNSTLAGALAAVKIHIPVAHVEAGLRSFNMDMPEEINRILSDRVSTWLFCPTDVAISNLEKEGFPHMSTSGILQQVTKSGDVMQDGAIFYSNFARKPEDVSIPQDFILATVHRAENTDNPVNLGNIVEAMNNIAQSGKKIILPLHPRTKKMLKSIETNFIDDVIVIDPVGYLEMVYLLKHCSMVMTDSGGLQKEAFFFKKPCITLRDETEWVELVDNGFNLLTGANKELIIDLYHKADSLFSDNYSIDLYGNGIASEKIVNELAAVK